MFIVKRCAKAIFGTIGSRPDSNIFCFSGWLIQRHEEQAEVERQKRAEQWRQLVVREEREERERKRKIESLQKLIKKEMQRKHRRCQSDVNSANSSMHIPNSHTDLKDFSKTPCCSSATNTTEQPTIETASAELTSPSSISTDVDIVLNDDAATVDQVELATTVEVQDVAYVLMEDEETKTEDYPTECKDSAADRDNAEHLHTLLPYAEASKSAQQLSITKPPVQDTVAALITQPAAHKSDATPTVQLTTELQIQQTDCAVITQPEANKGSEATPTVLLTTYVTKKQQCHSKEVQPQDTEVDTAVSMTQPTATQDSESTPQIIIDSDTRPEQYDTKFWYHLSNTDGLKKTPASMSTVFIYCSTVQYCKLMSVLDR